jgi:uncharacterized membrane protein (UPF0127 family)
MISSLGCAKNTHKKVCIKNACISAEIADTEGKRTRGLMFRKGLGGDAGMLFVYEKNVRPSFWMKNMRFPLDIIWIDKDHRIVDVVSDVQPCTDDCALLVSDREVQFILEVESGFVRRHNIKLGELVEF